MLPFVFLLLLQAGDLPLKRATLSFDGRGTLGDFTGTAGSVQGLMKGGPDLETVTGWVEAVVAEMRTGNGKRDKDMRKSMETDRFPTMRFDLDRVARRASAGDTTAVALHGRLTIHGVTKEVELPASVWRDASDWRLRTDFPLNVSDYQVRGLSKLLGVLKMNERIVVHVDLTFGP